MAGSIGASPCCGPGKRVARNSEPTSTLEARNCQTVDSVHKVGAGVRTKLCWLPRHRGEIRDACRQHRDGSDRFGAASAKLGPASTKRWQVSSDVGKVMCRQSVMMVEEIRQAWGFGHCVDWGWCRLNLGRRRPNSGWRRLVSTHIWQTSTNFGVVWTKSEPDSA